MATVVGICAAAEAEISRDTLRHVCRKVAFLPSLPENLVRFNFPKNDEIPPLVI
jgi:hypothetical protein